MKNKIVKIILASFLLVFSFASLPVSAQLFTPDGQRDVVEGMEDAGNRAEYNTVGGPDNFLISEVVTIVTRAVLGLLGIVFLIMIILGGFNWMTAAGNDDKVTKAKATLFRGVIGLFIVISAYVITAFVFRALSGIIGQPV